jgi:hypothetical protein
VQELLDVFVGSTVLLVEFQAGTVQCDKDHGVGIKRYVI